MTDTFHITDLWSIFNTKTVITAALRKGSEHFFYHLQQKGQTNLTTEIMIYMNDDSDDIKVWVP